MSLKYNLSALLLVSLVACTSDEIDIESPVSAVERITFLAKDYTADTPETRSFVSPALEFSWTAGDQIGIYPSTGSQISFDIAPEEEGKKNAVFDGGGWALREGYTYCAYFPYSVDNTTFGRSYDAIPFNYEGQVQSSNNNTNHIGKYDYMTAKSVIPEGGNINFEFEHQSALLYIPIKVSRTDTFKEIVLSTEDNNLVKENTVDVSTGNIDAESAKFTNRLVLKLNDITVEKDDDLKAWLMMAPVDLRGKKITISVKTESGNDFEIKVDGIQFLKSRAYTLGIDMSSLPDSSIPYFTLTSEIAGSLTLSKAIENLQYSVGDGTWIDMGVGPIDFGASLGDLRLRAINPQGTSASYDDFSTLEITGENVKASGDLRTLVDYKNFSSADMTQARFVRLFEGNMSLISAKELYFPSPMTDFAYTETFIGCKNLVEAPQLHGDIAPPLCFGGMFAYCSSLTEAPELPASTLFSGCYHHMFYGCTNLKHAPILNALHTANNCYQAMFQNCSHLNYIKMMAVDKATDAFKDWVTGISWSEHGGTFCYNAEASFDSNIIPSGWWYIPEVPEQLVEIPESQIPYVTMSAETSGTFAMSAEYRSLEYSVGGGEWKELRDGQVSFGGSFGDLRLRAQNRWGTSFGPADDPEDLRIITDGDLKNLTVSGDIRTLVDYRHYSTVDYSNAHFIGLLSGNTQLVSAEQLILPRPKADQAYVGMFMNCTKLEKAPAELDGTPLSPYCCTLMFRGCTSLKYAPRLPSTALIPGCYTMMFSDCSALEVPPALPATNVVNSCYRQMFARCTSLVAGPDLPATTVGNMGYYEMFIDCSRLKSVRMMATNYSSDAFGNWLRGTATNGTLYYSSSVSNSTLSRDANIPSGWNLSPVNN